MKRIPKLKELGKGKSVAGMGYAFTVMGLTCAVILVWQLIPAVIDGRLPTVSPAVVALEGTAMLIALMLGFVLLVVGADPFEDVSEKFDFDRDRFFTSE